jgi:ferredoxin
MKKHQLIVMFFTAILLMQFTTGCTPQSDKKQQTDSQSQTQVQNDFQAASDLIIGHSCTGCGRCVAVDSEHFIFLAGKKIAVISKTNLESEKLKNAISVCPSDAIKIL